jgi:hypothetical protein
MVLHLVYLQYFKELFKEPPYLDLSKLFFVQLKLRGIKFSSLMLKYTDGLLGDKF